MNLNTPQVSSARDISSICGDTPDFKINIGLEGLVTLEGERSKLKALLQQPLRGGNETGHRHGYSQEVYNAFAVVTIHVCR